MATTASLPTVALAWDDTAALADPGLLLFILLLSIFMVMRPGKADRAAE